MSESPGQVVKSRVCPKVAAGALMVWAVAMAWTMGWRDLWAPDEPRYAEVAREMVLLKDWVIPHLNGRVYPDKPPLPFWLIALSAKAAGGFTHLAVRVPSCLSAWALVALTGWMGRSLFGRSAGVFSALVMLSTSLLLWFLSRVNLDTLFAAGVVGAIFCFYVGHNGRARRTWTYPLAYALLGVAAMTKGPAAFPMVLVAVLSFVAWRRDWRSPSRPTLAPDHSPPTTHHSPRAAAKAAMARRRLTTHILGLILLAAVIGIWAALALHAGGSEYFRAMLLRKNLSMTIDSHSHQNPFYYYGYQLPAAFAPWVMFLIPAVARAYREARQNRRAPEAFLLAVSVALFVLMSLSSGKRINYLISLLPFLAVLVGREWAELWSGRAMTRLERVCAWLVAGALAAVGVAGAGFVAVGHEYATHALLIGALCALAAVGIAAGLRRANPRMVFAMLALFALGTALYVNAVFLPRLNAQKSLRPLALYLRELKAAQPEAQLATYCFSHPEGLNFYSGLMFEPIRETARACRFLAAEGLRLCIVDSDRLEELRQACKSPLAVLFEQRKGIDILLCVSNQPMPDVPRGPATTRDGRKN